MQPQARERDIFRASRRKWVSTPKFRPTAGRLRSDGRQGSKPAARRSPRSMERRFDVDCHGGRKLVET